VIPSGNPSPSQERDDIEIHFQIADNPGVRAMARRRTRVIVCHCQGVSDRSIRQAVREGARSVRQVSRVCRAGRMCGGCRPVISEIIEAESSEPATPVSFTHVEGLVGAG
jgi:bacterioferritin-associated ferredoxin